MSTIKEVSVLAGVSISTVSRVLNDTAPVAFDTKQRVLEAVKTLDFQPNTFARSLVTNRSGCLAVTVNEINSPSFGALLKGIESRVEPVGMHLIVSSGHAQQISEKAAITLLQQRRPDALIVQVEALSNEDLRSVLREDVPVVVVGRYLEGFPCVYLDNVAGGRVATNYLIEQGHKRIAHVSGALRLPDAQARQGGYQHALLEAGLTFDNSLVLEGNFSEPSGLAKTKELLERTRDFTAIFAANDQMAAGAMRALREAGLRVPEDVSVIGFDDISLAEFLDPLLTTVRQPLVEMGEATAKIALALIHRQETEVVRTFEPQLVIRKSVKQLN